MWLHHRAHGNSATNARKPSAQQYARPKPAQTGVKQPISQTHSRPPVAVDVPQQQIQHRTQSIQQTLQPARLTSVAAPRPAAVPVPASALVQGLTRELWLRVFDFVVGDRHTTVQLSLTCRAFCALTRQQRQWVPPTTSSHRRRLSSAAPSIRQSRRSSASSLQSQSHSHSAIPSVVKLERAVILSAASSSHSDVDRVVKMPWWRLDQPTIDTIRSSLLALISPPRAQTANQSRTNPTTTPQSLQYLSADEVQKWQNLSVRVDKRYVKQLRMRAKVRALVDDDGAVNGDEPVTPLSQSSSLSLTLSPSSPMRHSPIVASAHYVRAVPPLPLFLSSTPPQSSLTFWEQQVVPRWSVMRGHPLTLRVWLREGIPPVCRSQVWPLCVGNAAQVTEHVFNRYWIGRSLDTNGTRLDFDSEANGSQEVNAAEPTGSEDEEEEEEEEEYEEASEEEYEDDDGDVYDSDEYETASDEEEDDDGDLASTPLPPPGSLHAFSVPAVAMAAAEQTLALAHSHLETEANSELDTSIANDLDRMFDSGHLSHLQSVDELRAVCNLPSMKASMHSLLRSLALYRPEISYMQGLSYWACLLCLHLTLMDSFTALCNLVDRDFLRSWTGMRAAEISERFTVFDSMLAAELPSLSSHLTTLRIPPDLYFMDWELTFFVPILSFDCSTKIFDLYLLQGEAILFKVAVALLEQLEHELLDGGAMQCSQLLRARGEMMAERVDEEALLSRALTVKLTNKAKQFFRRSAH